MKSLSQKIDLKRSTIHVLVDIEDFTAEKRELVRKKFEEKQKNGIIICNNFLDNTWTIYNEVNYTEINFSFDTFKYRASQNTTPVNDFRYYLHAFATISIGSYIATTIKELIRIILQCAEITNYFMNPEALLLPENIPVLQTLCLSPAYHDFFTLFPIDGASNIAEIITDNASYFGIATTKSPRTMAEFQSYYLFERIMNRFWADETTEETERLYYYPLFLYWKLTTILPLRVSEFCLLPPECISYSPISKQYSINVRRTKLKGRNKNVTYTVEGDYKLFSYSIPEALAKEFLNYEKLSADYYKPDYNFFSADCQLKNHPKQEYRKRYEGGCYWRRSLYVLFCDFFEQIISERYGYVILTKKEYANRLDKGISNENDYLQKNEIIYIRPGDTRHIAMINLVLNGCNPMVIYEFSGHETIETACNYYGNVTNLMKSAAHEIFIMNRGNTTFDYPELYSNKEFLFRSKPFINVDGGRCYSSSFHSGEITDCINNNMKCLTCSFFLRTEETTPESLQEEERFLEDEHLTQLRLLEATLQIKNSDGKTEQLSIILKQLQALTTGLQKWYLEHMEGENANGWTK